MPQTTETGNVLPTVEADQFFAVDIRSAVVTAVEESRRPGGPPTSSGSTWARSASGWPAPRSPATRPGELVGTTVVCVVNFPPRRIAGFKSEVLVLGLYDADGTVVLLRPDRPVAPGHRVG
jgi:tRNA-binding protein